MGELLKKSSFIFFARANFLGQTLTTYKTFVFDRFSRLCFFTSKNSVVENGQYPPACSVYQLFFLARSTFGLTYETIIS